MFPQQQHDSGNSGVDFNVPKATASTPKTIWKGNDDFKQTTPDNSEMIRIEKKLYYQRRRPRLTKEQKQALTKIQQQ